MFEIIRDLCGYKNKLEVGMQVDFDGINSPLIFYCSDNKQEFDFDKVKKT